MAAAASPSTASGDESTDSGLSFTPRPSQEKHYELGADPEKWLPGDRRYPEVEAGGEDSKSERECQQQQQQQQPRRVDEDLATLSAEEIESRLERTRREFYNRRKIIIKNLPSDVNNQVPIYITRGLIDSCCLLKGADRNSVID